jgi:hypothetical protein
MIDSHRYCVAFSTFVRRYWRDLRAFMRTDSFQRKQVIYSINAGEDLSRDFRTDMKQHSAAEGRESRCGYLHARDRLRRWISDVVPAIENWECGWLQRFKEMSWTVLKPQTRWLARILGASIAVGCISPCLSAKPSRAGEVYIRWDRILTPQRSCSDHG